MINGFAHQQYADAALAAETHSIRATPKGQGLRNAALNRGAFKLGGLVGAGVLREAAARDALFGAAKENGYAAEHGERATIAVIEHGLRAGIRSPRAAPGRSILLSSTALTPEIRLRRMPAAQATTSKKIAEAEVKSDIKSLPARTPPDTNGKPRFWIWGENGPPIRPDEIRRHVYLLDGCAVRIKIKTKDAGNATFKNWYLVKDGHKIGWQAKKPEDYRPTPYITTQVDPFDSELKDDHVFWVEGEKDCDTLGQANLPAFCWGGCGDGLPAGIDEYLIGRHLVVVADNDEAGRNHAQEKAACAHRAGAASVRIICFDELPTKADVSDWFAAGGTAEGLKRRGDAAPICELRAIPSSKPPPTSAAQPLPGLEVLCLADVIARPIEWLWINWLAIGKVSVLAGDGGNGKSTILCDFAARVTRGERWPDGATGTAPGSVIILAAEDDVEDTLAPRLLGANADMRRIFNIRSVRGDDLQRRTFSLQADLAQLEKEIQCREEVRLVIIDPVTSYLGKVDSHKNAEVRSVLEPLGELAARMRVAVICNNHFSKGGGNANSRVIGSVAFVNQARAAFVVIPDAEDEKRLLLMPSKMNLAPIKHGLAYRIEGCLIAGEDGEIMTSRIGWESNPVTISADTALAAHDTGDEGKTLKAEAIDFLTDALANGPVLATDIQADARGAGISPKSLRSAREELGVKPEKQPGVFDGKWIWKMPKSAEDAFSRERASSESEGIFGGKL